MSAGTTIAAAANLRAAADHLDVIGFTGTVTLNDALSLHVDSREELDRLLALHPGAERDVAEDHSLAWWTASAGGVKVVMYESFARAEASGVSS